jgi:eukaryotic-like serine/threonine-protein kinase
LVGATIGSYRILGELGAGGMGAVYLAEHRHLGRKAAIKLLLKEFVARPDLLDRFFAEARATSLIDHPGIVQIFDCEVDADGRPYIVMEYLSGETLAACLRRRGALPPGEAAAYVRRMAEALAAAHDKGIIHRDIKPDNVFVKPGPPLGIKFVDFGIAKLAGEFHAGMRTRTQTGIVMGTPLYMSPEQCRGAGTVDHRTDIYSLGCVLFEMLCGRPPFQHEGAGELVVAHLTSPPPEVRALNPQVPVELASLVAAMLSKPADARPQTMAEVAERLAASEPPELAGPAAWPATGAQPLRPPPPVTGAQPLRPTTPAPPDAPLPQAQTTLRSTASEVVIDDAEMRVPRRRTGLVVAAVLVFASAAGAGLLWTRLRAPVPQVLTGTPTTSEPAPSDAGAAVVTAVSPSLARGGAEPPAAGAGASKPRAPVTRMPAPGGRRRAEVSPPRARPPVHITFESQPANAEVCFEHDRRLLGYTPRTVDLPADARRVTFLVYLPAHRLARVTVRADRDSRRSVRLEPVGGDELAPTGCLR